MTLVTVIDGCGVPAWLYQLEKARAMESGQTQFIGVTYQPPSRAQRDHVERGWHSDPSDSFNFVEVIANIFQPQIDLSVGRHCTFQAYGTREEVPAECLMVLWITPHAECVTHLE